MPNQNSTLFLPGKTGAILIAPGPAIQDKNIIKIFFCFITGLLFCLNGSAQCDSAYFRYTGTFLTAVSVVDTNIIIAGGDNGYIIKSYDGGNSWKNIRTPTNHCLNGLKMITDSVGYAVGDWKTILKTEDQGETWFPLFANIVSGFTNDGSSFNDLYFFDKDHGYIVGEDAKLVSTTDGGRNWHDTSFAGNLFTDITFINDSIGFICGLSADFFKTVNAGHTWQKVTPSFFTGGEDMSKVKFINDSTGFVIGHSGFCMKTNDKGLTWTHINTGAGSVFYDIHFFDNLHGIMVSDDGLILESFNGGNTWNLHFNVYGRAASYHSIGTDPTKKKVVIAGGGGYSEFLGYNGRNILSTIDSGATYQPLSRNGRLQYNDLCFLNDSTGFITGQYGAALKTSDYGETWKPLQDVPKLSPDNQAKKIFFLDDLHGYAGSDQISKTSDGGNSWTATTLPGTSTQYIPTQMFFYDTLIGFVQNNNSLHKTINGGNSWTSVATPQSGSFYRDFAFTKNGKGFAVGYGGKMQVSTDSGTTWAPYNLNTTKYLTSVYFYDNNLGFIGTGDTTIYKTTDGGANWTRINTGVPVYQVRAFHFLNPTTGYMMLNNNGGISFIYKTKNGGVTWFFIKQESENLSRIDGFKTIYMVGGGNGMILRTDTLQPTAMPGYIEGYNKACINSKSAYITGSVTGATYNWTLSGGGTNSFVANKDTVLWTALGNYSLSVTATGFCGTSPARTLNIQVLPPFQPTITQQDSILTATAGISYQWYRNGNPIGAPLGVAQSIVASLAGAYTVQVKNDYGCNGTSDAILYGPPVCILSNTTVTSNITGSSYQWQRNDGTGYVNILNGANFSGTNTLTLQIISAPSSWYGYKFRCVTSAGNSGEYTLRFVAFWTGAVSTAWETAGNWGCGKVPDSNTDVVINVANPAVISSNVTIRKLAVGTGAHLTVHAVNTLTVTH